MKCLREYVKKEHVSLDQDDSEIENLLLSLSKQTEDA